MAQYTQEDRKRFVEVFKAKNMHIGKACKAFNISRQSYYDWLKDEWFAELIREVEESEVDDAEEMHRWLRQGIIQTETDAKGQTKAVGWAKEPDRHAIQFFLERKGKKRGWQPETMITGNGQQGEIVIVRIPDNGRDDV